MNARAIIVLALLALPMPGGASTAQEPAIAERYNIGGYLRAGKTTPHAFAPHADPRPLPKATAADMAGRGNAAAASSARAYMQQFPATTGMMLLDRGRVVFEAYQGQGGRISEFYSMSIGKSMTSLAVGTALCAGRIPGLATPAGDIVPELAGGPYGRSTVRQLLTMSSGAYRPVYAGEPDFGGALGAFKLNRQPYVTSLWPLRLGEVTMDEILHGRLWQAVRHKHTGAPGERFVYKSGDTSSLGAVVARTTGLSLAAWFERTVWRPARTERTGHWEADRTGTTIAFAGVQMTMRDWARIGLWVLDRRGEDGCLGEYVRAATAKQIAIPSGGSFGSGYRGYGYQYWVDNPYAPGYWAKGYAGQEIASDPASGKILVKFSHRRARGSGAALFRLFRDWTAAE